jgi:hypothetical protein
MMAGGVSTFLMGERMGGATCSNNDWRARSFIIAGSNNQPLQED